MAKKKKFTSEEITIILDSLEAAYPDAGCALDYDTTFHLAIAVILSAQTTDVSVNKVTPILFDRYKYAHDLAAADISEVENIIRRIGLYKNKAKNIVAMAKALEERYDGILPGDDSELMELPGVGRKTANVIMAEGFGAQRIAVDTHVFRVSNRIGLAAAKDVTNTEKQLRAALPEDRWTQAHHLLIFHGRQTCRARNPLCQNCAIGSLCRYAAKSI